jgi:hypothetical protein
MHMADEKIAQIGQALKAEIETLEKPYQKINSYLSGTELENYEIIAALHAFRDSLNRVSAHILALYQLKGQKTKITWEPLLENINSALLNMQGSRNPKPRTAIPLALNMSEPKVAEVMAYLAKLKQSL